MCPIATKAAAGTGKPVHTFPEYEDATDWKAQLLESLALSKEAQNRLPLSPAEDNRISQARQQFPLMMSVRYAGLINGQETMISSICRSVKPASDLQLQIFV